MKGVRLGYEQDSRQVKWQRVLDLLAIREGHTHERSKNLAPSWAGRCKHDSLIPEFLDPWCVQRIRKDGVVGYHRVSEAGGNGNLQPIQYCDEHRQEHQTQISGLQDLLGHAQRLSSH